MADESAHLNPSAVESIFSAALVLAPPERPQYLSGACGTDTQLRTRVESLLRAHEEAAGFLPPNSSHSQSCSRGTSEAEVARVLEQPGDRVGRYRLLHKLGEGGCGVVYQAEQDKPVRREVALKVIKLGMDTKRVIARFQTEQQALALMDHPNIAKVLDAGATESGRPFFVMELVRGVKITDFCNENKLSTQQRLELFIKVCQAIQHAHQKGVIHRDIKPSNLLVSISDGAAEPKVIDFGIAKATAGQLLPDLSVFTEFQQFMGTPAYMSPEQAAIRNLDVDTRADIYSLGVLLYELLTGRTPFDQDELLQEGLDGMRRTILEKEPVRPSTRLSSLREGELTTTANQRLLEAPKLVLLVRGDLDWIVMKALEKDRSRRYATANGLAMDVRRFLNNEPVEARPPSSLYRLQKLVRRNQLVFAAAGAVVAALVFGLGAATWSLLKEKTARQRAVIAERAQSRLREDAQRAQANEFRLRQEAEASRQNEVKLRQQAEANERVLRVQLLLTQGKEDDAEKLIEQAPPDLAMVQAMFRIGFQHAVHKQWAAAASNFNAIVTLVPTEHLAYHFLAPLQIQNKDLKSYEDLRGRILKRFGTTSDSLIAERMAKDCLILPPARSDLPTLDRMTDTALKAGQKHWAWVYFRNAKGLAEYRLGQFAEAIEQMQAVAKVEGDPRRDVEAYSVLAMAHYQLHHLSEADAALARALEIEQTEFPKINRYSDPDWNDQLIAETLLLEARGLLKPATQPHE